MTPTSEKIIDMACKRVVEKRGITLEQAIAEIVVDSVNELGNHLDNVDGNRMSMHEELFQQMKDLEHDLQAPEVYKEELVHLDEEEEG